MTWIREALPLGRATGVDADAAEDEATPARASGGRAGSSLAAPIFAGLVLALTLGLMLWAPWRDERLALSDYGGRVVDASTPATSAVPTRTLAGAAATAPAVAATTSASVAAGAGPGARPVGLPIKRSDWIIVRDYIANGGPGATGAIDVGVVGNRDAIGTPIYATHDGTAKVVRNTRLLGNLVVVRSGRWITTYGYLDQVQLTDGQTVRRGDQLGTLGRSGQAPGPMLNYQVWEQTGSEEVNRNPMDFIAPR